MFKTEHFRLLDFVDEGNSNERHRMSSVSYDGDEEENGDVSTPYARFHSVTLTDVSDAKDADALILPRTLRVLPGFCGAHRLLSIGGGQEDGSRSYVVLEFVGPASHNPTSRQATPQRSVFAR